MRPPIVSTSQAILVTTWLVSLIGQVPLSAAWFSVPSINGSKPPSTAKPPSNVKLLILPGFGNAQEDYFLPQAPEGSLVRSLESRGWESDQVRVLPVERSDWINVFTRGALDRKFWANTAPPTRPAFRWYLDLIAQEMNEAIKEENDRVVLVGHSAGGWLGRAALGFGSQSDDDSQSTNADDDKYAVDLDSVLGIVTLGTPQLPPPPEVMDMTRGALRLTNEQFPNDYHAPNLFYVTVMGQSVQGEKQERQMPWEPTTVKGFAFNSYESVCGDGTVIGDGVVPTCAGHLEGAQQINLPNVLHSINAPSQWYGSQTILDSWHTPMMESIYRGVDEPSSSFDGFRLPSLLR